MFLTSLLLIAVQATTPEGPDPMTLGPAVGQKLPAFEAKDQSGTVRDFASLKGPNGLVLVFFRSADWCPFCKAQLMELQTQLEGFRKEGLGVAALSCDSVDILKDFSIRKKITYPLLSDPDSKVISAFGIMNEIDYPKGSTFHGIPFPGVYTTDAAGLIRRKDFEKTYQERRTAASFLVSEGSSSGVAVKEVQNPQFSLRTSMSNAEAAPGHRITLVLDFTMAPGIHAYAPGVTGYKALSFRLAPNPFVTPHDTVYPKSHPFIFEPLKETVPVYEGQFKILQDVTVLRPGRTAGSPNSVIQMTEVDVSATLDYQACSQTMCYPPSSIPLQWTIHMIPLDRERAPEALRKRTP